jgi:hypothetical protein
VNTLGVAYPDLTREARKGWSTFCQLSPYIFSFLVGIEVAPLQFAGKFMALYDSNHGAGDAAPRADSERHG